MCYVETVYTDEMESNARSVCQATDVGRQRSSAKPSAPQLHSSMMNDSSMLMRGTR